MSTSKKRYIVMGGLHGYMPSWCEVCDTRKEAVEVAASIQDLTERQERALSQNMYLELDLAEDGNEYIEITTDYLTDEEVAEFANP